MTIASPADISSQIHSVPHAEPLPSEHVSEDISEANAQAIEDAIERGNKEEVPAHFLDSILFTAGCTYHALTAPLVFISSLALGALSSSSFFPLKIKRWQQENLTEKNLLEGTPAYIAMISTIAINFFTPKSKYGGVNVCVSIFAGLLAGHTIYRSFEDSSLRKQVDIMAAQLSSCLDFVIDKISQIQTGAKTE